MYQANQKVLSKLVYNAHVAIYCGLKSRIFQNCPELEEIIYTIVQTLSLLTNLVISHRATSFITHIIIVEFQLGEAVACKVPNRALFCVSSCSKSYSFLRFVVHQIVLSSEFRRAPNRALCCVLPCSKSCSFSGFRRPPNRALFCSKSCSLLRFVVLQIVPTSFFDFLYQSTWSSKTLSHCLGRRVYFLAKFFVHQMVP